MSKFDGTRVLALIDGHLIEGTANLDNPAFEDQIVICIDNPPVIGDPPVGDGTGIPVGNAGRYLCVTVGREAVASLEQGYQWAQLELLYSDSTAVSEAVREILTGPDQ